MTFDIAKMDAATDYIAGPGNVGYSQAMGFTGRDSCFSPDYKTLIPNSLTDCSAGTLGAAKYAGLDIDLSGQHNTANAAALLKATGVGAVRPFTSLNNLRHGEIVIGAGHMVYMRTDDTMFSAEEAENGTPYGAPGDQTGQEVRMRASYMRSRGWTAVWSSGQTMPPPDVRPELRHGSTGAFVKLLQRGAMAVFPTYAGGIKAHGGADGEFLDYTEAWVREFQRRSGLEVDGVVGAITWAELAKYGI